MRDPFLVLPFWSMMSLVAMAYIYTASWRYSEKTEPWKQIIWSNILVWFAFFLTFIYSVLKLTLKQKSQINLVLKVLLFIINFLLILVSKPLMGSSALVLCSWDTNAVSGDFSQGHPQTRDVTSLSSYFPLTLKGLCGVRADPTRLQRMILRQLSESKSPWLVISFAYPLYQRKPFLGSAKTPHTL